MQLEILHNICTMQFMAVHSLSPSTKSCIGKQSFACSPASQRLKAGSGLSRHGQGKQPKKHNFLGESPKYEW